MADERLGARRDLVLQQGDIIALGGNLEEITSNMGLIGPEVADEKALNIPLDQAEILVTNKELVGKEYGELRTRDFAGEVDVRQDRARRRADPARTQSENPAVRCAVRRRLEIRR